jgi:hypothetical protein
MKYDTRKKNSQRFHWPPKKMSVTFLFNGLREKITLEGGNNKSLVSKVN